MQIFTIRHDHYLHHAGGEGEQHTLAHVYKLLENIMSAISDFKVKQDAHNSKVSADLDDLSTKIQTMNDLIAQLQATQGKITPEDQALLDQIDAAGQALSDKADAMSNVTPPVVPPVV